MLNYFLHGYDRCCAETVFLLDLGKSGLLAFTSLAAVYGYNKTENIDMAKLETKAAAFLRVTEAFRGYALSYKGLSMDDML